MEAAPTPRPPINLARMNWVKVLGMAEAMEETANNTAVRIRTFFLPMLSLKYPANIAPTTQPQMALLAAHPTMAEDRSNFTCR